MTDEITGAPAAPAPTGEIAAPVASENSTTPPTAENAGAADLAAESQKPPKVDGRLKRINELTYQLRETQRQSEAREQRMLGIIEQMHKGGTAKEQQQAPKIEDYQDISQFIQASIEHFNDGQKPAKEQTGREQPKSDPKWDSEVESLMMDGEEKYEDFTELMGADIGLTNPMKGYILFDADNRVDLAYHLATNPKEVRRLSRLSPAKQIVELGRIEDKLTSKPAPKQPSKAPAPVEPIGGAQAESSGIRESMPYKEFLKERHKQLGRK